MMRDENLDKAIDDVIEVAEGAVAEVKEQLKNHEEDFNPYIMLSKDNPRESLSKLMENKNEP